jgi:5'-3' exonuclease
MTCKEYKKPDLSNAVEIYEDALIQLVIIHLIDVVREIGGPKGVFIAIDGVVPMAKMRQQRLRRFKSVWERQHNHSPNKWDTNAITPGTVFMSKLADALQVVCDKQKWVISTSNEPGEGEHKIMAELRSGSYKGENIVIYGMDADLIVLSLLSQTQNQLGNVWTCREIQHSAPHVIPVENMLRGPTFEWLSIDVLKGWILKEAKQTNPAWIQTYCFAMSVLGNDFLPSSLGLKMRDGGHDELLRHLSNPLVDGYQINYENLFELFRNLSQYEPHRIAKYIQGKQRMANQCGEKGLGENNWPLSCIEEGLIGRDWMQGYWKIVDAVPSDVCQEYLTGIKWIWAYYTGRPVCFTWFYPYSLPALWIILS